MLVMAMVDSLSVASVSAMQIAQAAAARTPLAFVPAQEPQPRRVRQAAVLQQLVVLLQHLPPLFHRRHRL
jgi:hypothetical protein